MPLYSNIHLYSPKNGSKCQYCNFKFKIWSKSRYFGNFSSVRAPITHLLDAAIPIEYPGLDLRGKGKGGEGKAQNASILLRRGANVVHSCAMVGAGGGGDWSTVDDAAAGLRFNFLDGLGAAGGRPALSRP